ncbi:MAG TPA: tetratricopeptide repeat protein [Candidatus Krumholzibacterium sp.]|nr:tetratricopeptide repeat protein [Candidatus Krumholzibacterium sp.]
MIDMNAISLKAILLAILVVAAGILVLMMVFQKKRKRRSNRSRYVDALYALIEGRKDDALRLLTEAVRNGETDIDAYIQLGNLLREKKQPEKALQIHRSLTVRRDMGYEEEKSVQLALAEDLADLGKMDRAIAALDSIHRRRKDPDITLMLHRLYHRSGDTDSAFSMLKVLGGIDRMIGPGKKAAYLASVASDHFGRGDLEKARQYVKKALKEDPRSIPAKYLAGTLEMKDGEFAKAADSWTDLLRLDISYFNEVITKLEKCLFESGNFDDLEKVLLELSAAHEGNQSISVELASYHIKKGEIETGLQMLEDGKRFEHRKEFPVTIRIASLYLEAGRDREARRILDESLPLQERRAGYNCNACGARSAVPREYCGGCSSFGSYIRKQ